jgi:hypothetical protein
MTNLYFRSANINEQKSEVRNSREEFEGMQIIGYQYEVEVPVKRPLVCLLRGYGVKYLREVPVVDWLSCQARLRLSFWQLLHVTIDRSHLLPLRRGASRKVTSNYVLFCHDKAMPTNPPI